ncbi:MAG: glycosyltransferase family 25 protein [Planktothrix sp.]|uniref:glycosyltransferase family 25 protein n=1 Tax=Planktothrix sp. TaxID=3088171 RepID=UPI0038D4A014
MNLSHYFDRIYIVFLPERTERVNRIKFQIDRLNLDSEKVIWFPGLRFTEAAGFPKASVRGCVISQYTILNQALEAGLEKVLILQDDCNFSRYFLKNQDAILQELATTEWDFAYLGHGQTLQKASTYFVKADPKERIMLTHCCAYHRRVIPRLVELISEGAQRSPGDPRGGPMYFDGFMNFFRSRNPEVITVMASPSLAWQQASTSSLNPKSLENYKFLIPVFKLVRFIKNTILSLK